MIALCWFVHFRIAASEKIDVFSELPKISGHIAVFDLGTFRFRAQKNPPRRVSKFMIFAEWGGGPTRFWLGPTFYRTGR